MAAPHACLRPFSAPQGCCAAVAQAAGQQAPAGGDREPLLFPASAALQRCVFFHVCLGIFMCLTVFEGFLGGERVSQGCQGVWGLWAVPAHRVRRLSRAGIIIFPGAV